MSSAFSVRAARWDADQADIARLRRRVFIEEQGVPEALEWEAVDADCAWFVATADDGRMVGVVRLRDDACLGRMAVLPDWRRRGVGAALLAATLDAARRRGWKALRLSAQIHALPFYARFGFRTEGDEYLDAGIAHRAMRIDLGASTT